jgi:hypothetical protein
VIALVTAVLLGQTADRPAGEKPIPGGDVDLGGYHLQRRDKEKGGYVWRGPHMSAFVAEDGRVSFVEEKGLPGQVVAPVAALAQAHKAMASVAGQRGSGGGKAAARSLLDSATRMVTNPTMALSDEDLRHDHHHAAKMAFLEATAEFRADLRAAFDRKARGGAVWGLRQRVRTIAGDESRPLAERHRLIFELWQECEDSADGARARAAIEDETRRQLAAGGPRAFSAGELGQLNAGQVPAFEPYKK